MTTTTVKRRPRRKAVEEEPEEEVHPLEHLIPAEWFAEDYVPRKIGGILDLVILNEAHSTLHNVILRGPTGSAKTSLVYAYAAGARDAHKVRGEDGYMYTKTKTPERDKALPVVYVPCNGSIEPSQLLGRWVPQVDGSFKFVPGLLILACIYGGIIYLDEVNFMQPRIGAVIHGLLDKRRTIVVLDADGSGLCNNCGHVNEVVTDFSDASAIPECAKCSEQYQSTQFEASADTQVIAAYNSGAEYEGTVPLNAAFLNRFSIKLQWEYERAVEEEIINSTKLLDLAGMLRDRHANGDLRTPVSTNMLMEFEEFAVNPVLGFAFACENFLSAFHDNERSAVLEVLELHTADIKKELEEV